MAEKGCVPLLREGRTRLSGRPGRCATDKKMLGALAAAELLLRHCVRRFGGVTGDVFGGVAETAATAALVVLTFGT
ncbi:predicted protein [Streptomyces filamentosus NRRL 15998]|uniref:Predicted protein n=1 Tax=Streptomyces filamentosus NRRL 15998 TaxID=457431 RepID=D6ASF5_STRFL|nr:predicted protein [Streptomyces filamentosus NRRL 15998]